MGYLILERLVITRIGIVLHISLVAEQLYWEKPVLHI